MKRLDLVIGPDGAGKSTFVALTLAPLLPGSAFVNADEIARQRWPDDPAANSYAAAGIAADTRAALIEAGRSFIAETVFSHPSKLELIGSAQAAGYTVVVHAVLIPEDLAVQRVAHRVRAGGHSVPETKIRSRHQRLGPLLAAAIATADSASVYDNSRIGGPRILAQFSAGLLIGAADWPDWTPAELATRWPSGV